MISISHAKDNWSTWSETTSFHGVNEIKRRNPAICNIFWGLIVVIMTTLVVMLNYNILMSYLDKFPTTAVEWEEFQTTKEAYNFYRAIYCSSDFLNVSKLIDDGVKYAAVIYAMLLVEGNPIDTNLVFNANEQGEDFQTLMEYQSDFLSASAKANFGGGLLNFLTITIPRNDDGEMMPPNKTDPEKPEKCMKFGCVDLTEKDGCPECFLFQMRKVIRTELIKAKFLTGNKFMDYLESKNFMTVNDFLRHYASDFQMHKEDAPKEYVYRYRRMCQVLVPDLDPTENGTFRFPEHGLRFQAHHSISSMSICGFTRRAISLYTGTEILDDVKNSFPYASEFKITDQMFGQHNPEPGEAITTFMATLTKYSRIHRKLNRCNKNDPHEEKYPYYADMFSNCKKGCNTKYHDKDDLCSTRLRSMQDDNDLLYCIERYWYEQEAAECKEHNILNLTNHLYYEMKYDVTTLDSTGFNGDEGDDDMMHEDFEQIADKMRHQYEHCHEQCDQYKAGFCNTYEINIQMIESYLNRGEPKLQAGIFTDTLFLKTPKGITSYNEYPQISIEQMFSQIGGNLGLFMGASWISFIHLCVTCCCYSCMLKERKSWR